MNTEKIMVAPGPEDMVLDLSASPRLIISCGDFFKPHQDKRQHAIYYYNLASGDTGKFRINGLPEGLEFFPHGIDLDKSGKKLYVIFHDRKNSKKNSGVAMFMINGNELQLIEPILRDEKLLKTPNDLAVADDGTLYITNEGGFSFGDIVGRFFMRKSFVTRYDPATKVLSRAYKKTWVANGIHVIGDRVYIVDSFKKSLIVTTRNDDGSLSLEKKIRIAKNLDNISERDGKLYIPSHKSSIRLAKSRKKKGITSPFSVHTVDIASGKVETIITPEDRLPINAVSTALVYGGNLYLSQIFEDFILKVKYP